MAIRSNVLQEKATSAPLASRPIVPMAFWIAGGVLASAAISGSRIPSVADVFIHLTIAAVVFGAMILACAGIMRESIDETLSRFASILPIAVGGAIIAAWTGLWNDGSGAIALPFGQAVLFVVTGGIVPLKLGPDVFLRWTTALSILLVVYRMRSSGPARQVRMAVTSWITGAIVLLIPSFAASILAMTRGVAIATAQDALRVMGAALADSYWSAFQQERFLTGIGDQLGVMVGFWTAAITLIVGVCLFVGFAVAIHREEVRRVTGMIFPSIRSSIRGWAIAGAVVLGFLISSAHPMRTLQLVPVLLLIISLAALAGRFLFDQPAVLIVGLFSSALLGWPVFAVYVICAGLCMARDAASGTGRIWITGVEGAAFLVLGAAFGVRSSLFPPMLASWAVPMGVLVAGLGLVGSIGLVGPTTRIGTVAMRELVIFCGVLVICAIFMGFVPGLAIAALAGLAAFAMQKKADLWPKYAGSLLLLAGWVLMGFKLFVGR